MPTAAQLGGPQPAPYTRIPFYPTAPWYSTNPNVGYQTRFYSCGITSAEADYAVGSETLRPVQFDRPVRIVAFNGAANLLANPDSGVVTQSNMNILWAFRAEDATGDKIHANGSRLAYTVVGSAERPGELGGHGWNIDQGGTLMCYLTPLDAGLRIDLTIVALEMAAPRNFSIR